MAKISCIIPAYNEEKGIKSVLSVVTPLIGKDLLEVIVINDGSNDKTKEIVNSFSNVILIEHKFNQGKSKTVVDGILKAKGEYIFMLDADLLFLKSEDILDLISPINKNQTDIAFSYRKNAWPLFPFKKIDYCTGERIFPKVCVLDSLKKMENLKYGLEVFLNRIYIKNNYRLAVVHWDNVENDFHINRGGLFKGIKKQSKIWSDVLREVGIIGIFIQNIKLEKLLLK